MKIKSLEPNEHYAFWKLFLDHHQSDCQPYECETCHIWINEIFSPNKKV